MTQAEALDILKAGHNVYLTGSAGSGKTYVLNKYLEYLLKNNVDAGVTASTGIAATHLGGVTVHSWTGIGVKDSLDPYELEALEAKRYLWNRFDRARVLVIDEVSMLHHFRLDMIELVCRFFKRNELPFGGLQVVLCGDLFQLPPVSRSGEPAARFAHHSNAWKNMNLKVCYLEEQHRQKDKDFLRVLNDMRDATVSADTLNILMSRFDKRPESDVEPTKLYTHNVDVDAENAAELAKLNGQEHVFAMVGSGREHIVETLKKGCLAPDKLRLKTGARVMFVKNNPDAGYANGTLGTVVSFDSSGLPVVRTAKGAQIVAKPETWQISEEGKVLAEISQIPLRLAWAITVHKSQGMSLDAVQVDLSKSFEKGMGYVALSRVRSLAGLSLVGLNDHALDVNPEVAKFDLVLRELSDKAAKDLRSKSKEEIAVSHQAFLARVAPAKKPAKKAGKKTSKKPKRRESNTIYWS